MPPKLIDLRPDRLHLDPNFNGYKLCLDSIPSHKESLTNGVHQISPSNDQYSYLHAKLFALHNHLTGETLNNNNYVYFIDKCLQVQKAYLDTLSNSITIVKVWDIPQGRERKEGDYNYSLRFVSDLLAVISDGTGILYLINTGSRENDDNWQVVFCDEVIGPEERFVIQDAVLDGTKLYCLLYNIELDPSTSKCIPNLYWVTLTKTEDCKWGPTALRKLQSNGDIHYAYIERNTYEAVYCVSDNGCKFTIDSENPIEEKPKDVSNKVYQWLQTDEKITLKFSLPSEYKNENIDVDVQPTEICVKYQNGTLLEGKLLHGINADTTTWTVVNDHLELILFKNEAGLTWSEIIEGDQAGEQILDSAKVEDANRRLEHLCSDTEVPRVQCEQGTTFNSQQIEECDFEDDKLIIFERLCCKSHEVTHKANLGSHHILLTTNLTENLPPAMAIRYDVDGCLWQPQGSGDDFTLKHESTLFAFGYVQASKQQKKFCACSPDMNCTVICEYNRHMFIYRQNKSISNAELRNRTTGRRYGTVAQQQVVNISDEEVLGLYICNSNLFLLTENSITIYQL